MMRPGMIPPVPLDQARAASKAYADQTLRDEIEFLRGEVADIQRRADRLATAWAETKAERDRMLPVWEQVEKLVNEARDGIWSSSATCNLIMARYFGITSDKPTVREIRGALHPEEAEEYRQLQEHRARSRLTVVEPDDDELTAAIKRHPAGKRRHP